MIEEVQCHHCNHIRTALDKYCPLCRRKPSDTSGKHPQRIPESKSIPVIFSPIGKPCTVVINRGQGQRDLFSGIVVRDSGSHLGVQHKPDRIDSVEFFPVQSDRTIIFIKEDNSTH